MLEQYDIHMLLPTIASRLSQFEWIVLELRKPSKSVIKEGKAYGFEAIS